LTEILLIFLKLHAAKQSGLTFLADPVCIAYQRCYIYSRII